MTYRFPWTVTLALAGAAAAQDLAVFPSDHTAVEGARTADFGPLSQGATRSQLIYGTHDIAMPDGASILRVGFRQDGDSALTEARIRLEIRMGAASSDPRNASRTFADNYDGAPTTVFGPAWVTLPARPTPAQKPADSHVLFTLDTPYRFDASKNLIVDYLVHENDQGNQWFSYAIDRATAIPSVEHYGVGCGSYQGNAPVASTFATAIGRPWSLDLLWGPPGASGLLFVGVRRQDLALDPFGMPSCRLLVDPMIYLPVVTAPDGTYRFVMNVPDDPFLHGVTLFNQWVIRDPQANAAGIVTSSAAAPTFRGPPFARWVVGGVGSSSGGTSNGDLVSVFEYQ